MHKTVKEIDGYPYPYVLWLDNSDRMKGNHWLLQFLTKEKSAGFDLADRFKQECYRMPRPLNWFHQGGCTGKRSAWHMFEFWSNDEDAILEACMNIAKELGLELQLGELTRETLDHILN